MKSIYFYSILACFFCITQNSHSQQAADSQSHVVKMGETVYSIAKTYKVSVDDIYALNPDAKESIRTSQVLRIPATANNKDVAFTFHSIQPKETLYSISKHYNISVEDILSINSGLNAENCKFGTAIRIPQKPITNNTPKPSTENRPSYHTVEAKETLYSIARLYDTTPQLITDYNPEIDLRDLKVDAVLRIPKKGAETSQNNNLAQTTSKAVRGNAPLKVALLLPFIDVDDNLKARMVEYYEGFLLAIDDIKKKGYSLEVYTFDIGKGKNTQKLESLLETSEMKNLDLIIGGINDEEVAIISEFAQKHNTKYAIPLPIKNDKIIKGNNTYQLNIQQAYLYPKVANRFSKQFANYNVIIVEDSNEDTESKKDFVAILKSVLGKEAISTKTISVENIATSLPNALSTQKNNIVVPASSSTKALGAILPAMREAKSKDATMTINLFGYPSWQTYSSNFLGDFFNFGTYIYSAFYVNSEDTNANKFTLKYRQTFGKTLINTYPRFGLLGYDSAMYFMTSLAQDKDLTHNSSNLGIQSAFNFEKVKDQKGYFNTGLYFVYYKPNMTIEKIDLSK